MRRLFKSRTRVSFIYTGVYSPANDLRIDLEKYTIKTTDMYVSKRGTYYQYVIYDDDLAIIALKHGKVYDDYTAT